MIHTAGAEQHVDPEALEPPPNDQHRAPDRERRAHDRDDREPEHPRLEPEQPRRRDVGDLAHRPELDGGPPDELHDVQRRGQERASGAEHGAEQHHRGDALAFARERDERERDAPDQRADPDREERAPRPERRDEQRPRHHHEQPDRQVEPQDGEVEPAQIATFGRDGADAPRGGLALQDLLEAFGDARHVRSLRRCDPDQVPRVAGGGPRCEPEPASQPGSPDSPALGSMLPAR